MDTLYMLELVQTFALVLQALAMWSMARPLKP